MSKWTPFTFNRDTWRVIGLRYAFEICISRRHRGVGLAYRQGAGWRTRYIFVHPTQFPTRRFFNAVGW